MYSSSLFLCVIHYEYTEQSVNIHTSSSSMLWGRKIARGLTWLWVGHQKAKHISISSLTPRHVMYRNNGMTFCLCSSTGITLGYDSNFTEIMEQYAYVIKIWLSVVHKLPGNKWQYQTHRLGAKRCYITSSSSLLICAPHNQFLPVYCIYISQYAASYKEDKLPGALTWL